MVANPQEVRLRGGRRARHVRCVSRLCNQPTLDGRPCTQLIEDWNDHCEAGHKSPPIRARHLRTWDVRDSSAASLSAEIDELVRPKRVAEVAHGNEPAPILPPWRLRTAALSLLGGMATDGALLASGVHSPAALALLGLIGMASPVLVGAGRHRDQAIAAREAEFNARRESRRVTQLQAISSSLEQIALELETVTNSEGRARDEARGRVEALSISALRRALSEGARVAMFRLQGAALVPTLTGDGWHRRPQTIEMASETGSTIGELASTGRCLLLTGDPGRPERIIAPVVVRNTLFGAILAESVPEKPFDDIDIDLVAGYARLVGLGLGAGRLPFEEESPSEESPVPVG